MGARELGGRQQEIWHLLSSGFSNAEIANEMHVSRGTVKTYVERLLPRLKARNRVHAAYLCGVEEGLRRQPLSEGIHFEVYEDKEGQWRWRLVSTGNGRVIATSGEGFVSRSNAERSRDLVVEEMRKL